MRTGGGRLTERQSQVVAHVAAGLATKQIAIVLGISERAVSAVLSRLFRRYGVANRAGLIAALLAQGAEIPVSEFTAYQRVPFMAAVTKGPEHRYVFVNELAARVAGRAAATLVGRALREIYPDIDAQYLAALDEVYRSGRPWGITNAPARFTHPDGTFRDTRLNLIFQPIRDDAGAVTGILHVGTELPD